MMTRKLLTGVVFSLSCILLTANFLSNFTRVGETYIPNKWRADVFETFQTDTDNVMYETLEKIHSEGYASTGGFHLTNTKKVYLSCFALSVKVGVFGSWLTHGDSAQYVKSANLVFSLLLAILLTTLFLLLSKEFGPMTGVTAFVLTICSNWLVYIARNTLWMFFVSFTPLVLSFLLFPRVIKGKLKGIYFLLIIGGAVCLQALNIYEYITNIILSASVPVVYYSCASRKTLKYTAKWIVLVTMAGILGVMLAASIHFIQLSSFLGSFKDAVDTIWGKFMARTYGPATSAEGSRPYHDSAPAQVSVWLILHQYMTLKMASIPFLSNQGRQIFRTYLTLGSFFASLITLSIGIFATAAINIKKSVQIEEKHHKLLSLAIATFWALGASLSWSILFKGHAYHHLHMNGISFYIPFVIMFYLLIGSAVSLTLEGAWAWITQIKAQRKVEKEEK